MTILSPKYCVTCIAILFAFHVNAQNSIIKEFNNGKVKLSYQKTVASNTYELQLVYKNDQVIYTQESDSITLHSQLELNELNESLQKVIASLADEKANPIFEKASYKIFKSDKGMQGSFVSISNLKGTIVTSFSKFQTLDFLEWLKSIEFGKE